MRHANLLELDGAGNVALGLLLLVFPARVIDWLGVPASESAFYPSLFGAVLVGIGVALLYERLRSPASRAGLGIVGAAAINICFGVALAGWLLVGPLSLPLRGRILLWVLTLILVALGSMELIASGRRDSVQSDFSRADEPDR